MTAGELGQPAQDVKTPEPDDLRMWSVTTIIGTLDKPALVYWSAEETARAAVEQQKSWQGMADEDPEQAIEWLKGARFRRPRGQRTAAQLGTEVHEACETYALSGVRPQVDDEVRPFLDQFDRFLDRFQPEYQATEVAVYNETFGYAGTCDGFLTIDGMSLAIDYKTSRKSYDKSGKPTQPYPEAGLQLAAYRYAELAAVWRPRRFEHMRRRYYLLGPAERSMAVPVPEVDGGAVIHITPEHCNVHPVRCDQRIFESFLYVMEAARYQLDVARTIVGTPLVPPAPTKEN